MQNPTTPALSAKLRRRKPRQRKKLRVGEFSEYGFSLQARLKADLTADAQDALLDAWLFAVDAQGVSFGGQFDARSTLEGIVFPVGIRVVDDTVRTALLDWLKARPEIESLQASEMFDIWHGA
jgi:hypothetical protein